MIKSREDRSRLFNSLGKVVMSVCFILSFSPLLAQKKVKPPASDSLKIEGNSFVIVGDTTILIKNDSSYIYSDNDSLIKPLQGRSYQAEEFYDNLKSEFYKTKVTKEVFDLLFRTPSQPSSAILVKETENTFIRYEGKIIGNTTVQKLNVFGPDIKDTTRQARSWLEKTGNAVHMNTRERVIKKNLLYEKGDKVNSLLLADNERIIRDLTFIKDARIYIIPRRKDKDTVDILILTKDVWSLSFELNSASFEGARFGFDEKNIFGVGHELENAIVLSSKYPQKLGYEGRYIIPNINGSFINSEIHFKNTYFRKGYGVLLQREFVSPEIKWGGGMELAYLDLRERFVLLDDSTEVVIPNSYNLSDFWLLRSFRTDLIYQSDQRSRIVLGGRVHKRNYMETPEVRGDTNQVYHDRTMYIASIGFFRQRYYRDILVFGYGRTEDIPYGSVLEFTSGVEAGQYYTRPYGGIRMAKGAVVRKLGYLYGSFGLGGYIRQGKPEQAVMRFDARYFSNLIWYNKFKFRQFFNFNFTRGINRFDYELININGEKGIRGISKSAFRGTSRFAMSMETVVFTPYEFVGFNFAIFAFGDMGIIQRTGGESVFKGDAYYGFGFGLRFRNENLTFNTFQLRIAYYPNVPSGTNLGINLSGLPDLRLNEFYIQKPSIIEFD